MRYEVRRPQIVDETIDGEVVIINLESGCYYSLRETGAAIWEAVSRGASAEGIVAELSARYDPAEELEDTVRRLLAELESEGLTHLTEDESAGAERAAGPDGSNNSRLPFAAPQLEKYTDMEDLLLLDPVHDVDQRGWPNIARGE